MTAVHVRGIRVGLLYSTLLYSTRVRTSVGWERPPSVTALRGLGVSSAANMPQGRAAGETRIVGYDREMCQDSD
jgi:hypothetical protein